jgi:sterol 3beta-glucosyltransferase
MRITILGLGSRGDVQPYVALGKGLQTAGHEVTLATHTVFEPLVREVGLRFHLVQSNPQEVIQSEAGQAMMASGNPLHSFGHLFRALKPIFWQTSDDCWNACQGADLIVYSTLEVLLATSIAEKLRIPAIAASLQPIDVTGDFPCLLVTNRNLGKILNRWTYLTVWQGIWLLIRPILNAWRRERLNLPPLSMAYFPWQWNKTCWPIMYGFSPQVIPKPADWGEHITVTGYWFLEEADHWQPPTALIAFLESGPPPVYIGFGSMSTRNPEEMTALVLQALERTKQRGLLLTGWGGLSQSALPDHVFKIEYAPHDWLFPRMAAVVHHGGAGTTGAGLRAGVPNIVIPFLVDQPFWGKRVAALGAGPQPILRKKLTVDRLAAAMTTAVTDTAMRRRAAVIGERIRAENGVANAVAWIHQTLRV